MQNEERQRNVNASSRSSEGNTTKGTWTPRDGKVDVASVTPKQAQLTTTLLRFILEKYRSLLKQHIIIITTMFCENNYGFKAVAVMKFFSATLLLPAGRKQELHSAWGEVFGNSMGHHLKRSRLKGAYRFDEMIPVQSKFDEIRRNWMTSDYIKRSKVKLNESKLNYVNCNLD